MCTKVIFGICSLNECISVISSIGEGEGGDLGFHYATIFPVVGSPSSSFFSQ